MRCVALDGQTVARYGQRHAPVSLSARQAKGLGLLTSGTYGPPHIGLSASVALSWFLASNLAALTRTTGSTLYKLTWKPWAMPSGRLRFRLRASARRTRETVLIGWPTPIASNGRGAGNFNRQGGGKPSDSGVISGVAHTNHEQRPLALSARSYADASRQWNKDSEAAAGCSCIMRPGPVNGFWRDADWLHGQDGWWRPVRPGSFPLANGVPARVGRVRTYGNAINIEAAAAFIKSYMAAVDHV